MYVAPLMLGESQLIRSIHNIDRSQRIPLTPDYSVHGGNGCLKKETRLRGNKGEKALRATRCKNGDFEIL